MLPNQSVRVWPIPCARDVCAQGCGERRDQRDIPDSARLRADEAQATGHMLVLEAVRHLDSLLRQDAPLFPLDHAPSSRRSQPCSDGISSSCLDGEQRLLVVEAKRRQPCTDPLCLTEAGKECSLPARGPGFAASPTHPRWPRRSGTRARFPCHTPFAWTWTRQPRAPSSAEGRRAPTSKAGSSNLLGR